MRTHEFIHLYMWILTIETSPAKRIEFGVSQQIWKWPENKKTSSIVMLMINHQIQWGGTISSDKPTWMLKVGPSSLVAPKKWCNNWLNRCWKREWWLLTLSIYILLYFLEVIRHWFVATVFYVSLLQTIYSSYSSWIMWSFNSENQGNWGKLTQQKWCFSQIDQVEWTCHNDEPSR